jgi:hypothetical protein
MAVNRSNFAAAREIDLISIDAVCLCICEGGTMWNQRCIIGTFYTYQEAEQACTRLNQAGFLRNRISVIANSHFIDRRKSEVSEPAENNRSAAAGAIAGSMVGAIGGCLLGLGVLTVPGVGLVVAAGTTGTTLLATLVGAGIGVACGGSIEILAGLDTTDLDRSKVDGDASQHKYLVTMDGTDDEVHQAESIVEQWVHSVIGPPPVEYS